ncbi:GDSL-type esterase/lipase family protein [Shewanella dokdonensis]|uniref:GDSL-type esterase/lipase family protein n=1 Tax=Shewanella dokdonensis TaxID=712036 RepID=UPI00200C289C|nr:GDSL-type esterase/lipase family protein [Shewanella dokdonensis]MCL1074480.1 GDSL-type esterase/lipase family protein [Shewanella dokdonensis]
MLPRVALSFLLLLGLSACSDPSLPYLGPDGRILAFGDSLTVGKGAARDEDYPAQLAKLCGCEVVNAGISGEQTAEGRKRLPALLDEMQPDLLILLEGGNDILRGVPSQQIQDNLQQMLLDAQSMAVPVLLIAVPQKQVLLQSAPFYKTLAKQHDSLLMDDVLRGLLSSPALKSDAVHLNAAGYQQLATAIYHKLKEAGAF